MIRPAASTRGEGARSRAITAAGFTHLHVHSNFSMLAGTRPVEDLVAAAARRGMEALALTDTDAMHAVVPFAFVHATPHPAQSVTVSSAASQPLPLCPSQSA